MDTEQFMCERDGAMTPERLNEIAASTTDFGCVPSKTARELIGEIRGLWEDKLYMVPMEQA